MLMYFYIGILLIVLIIYGYGSNYACKVTKQTILLKKSNKDFSKMTFAIISDLHGQRFGKNNERLLRKIRENHPDVIVIPGDMIIKNGKGKKNSYHLLKLLEKDYPVFYSPGNHEIRLENHKEFQREVKKLGVSYLENSHISHKTETGQVEIYGLSLPERYYGKIWNSVKLDEDRLVKYLGYPKKDRINVLLAHNPEYMKQYTKWGADIVISGHYHGGIVSFWFGGLIAPSLRLFPNYSKGYYQKNNTHLYVSRGLGLHHIKLRFFNLPELVILTVAAFDKDMQSTGCEIMKGERINNHENSH